MRLADFITSDMERILTEWDAFAAAQMPAARDMTGPLLRDHAREMLQAIVLDLSASQTREAQATKSRGRAPVPMDAPQTAAQTHGLLRAQSGFELKQMAAEYRALRASVLRLWIDACQGDAHLEDVIRFNEAVDQALAESITFFSEKLEESRNLFLGMLGHDMRTPLQAILSTAEYLEATKAGMPVSRAAGVLIRSGERMQALLADLVEFNRTKLGLGMLISPAPVDAAVLFDEEVELIRASHPGRLVQLKIAGPTTGTWDSICVQRLLDNLLVNALKYGDPGSPILVSVTGDDEDLRFDVVNTGPHLDQPALASLFEPLRRGAQPEHVPSRSSLGLGLYIAREIAKAHGGEIEARSQGLQTVFSVRLPRHVGAV